MICLSEHTVGQCFSASACSQNRGGGGHQKGANIYKFLYKIEGREVLWWKIKVRSEKRLGTTALGPEFVTHATHAYHRAGL